MQGASISINTSGPPIVSTQLIAQIFLERPRAPQCCSVCCMSKFNVMQRHARVCASLTCGTGPCDSCGWLSSRKWHRNPLKEDCLCTTCYTRLVKSMKLQSWGETKLLTFREERCDDWESSQAEDCTAYLRGICTNSGCGRSCKQGETTISDDSNVMYPEMQK